MIYDKELIQRVATYVRAQLWREHTGHDWFHAKRVLKLSRLIQKNEGGDLMLIELTALLHDLGDYKRHDYSEIKGNLALNAMMDILEIGTVLHEKIMKIVIESQFKGKDTKTPSTIEGKIIQDADWLETLGAIGIARAFATGGNSGRMIYDPEMKPRNDLGKLEYQIKKAEGTTFNYFFEKSLKLPMMMNTQTGKEMARQRVNFLELYIKEFLNEWKGER